MHLGFAEQNDDTRRLIVLTKEALPDWLAAQDDATRVWVQAHGFVANVGQALMLPDMGLAVAGYGTAGERARGRFALAAAVPSLPSGDYRIEGLPEGDAETEALGWLLTGYVFDRYRKQTAPTARLVAPDGVDAARIEAWATGEALTRDLINTPAGDMGPSALEAAARNLATRFGASIEVTLGDALLEHNFPMIHAVGRAASDAPRLIDISHGNSGPRLTLVGKGVCFDTGGLNLKPGASMALMKKDMGGSATVLGLAQMILTLGWPVQLRVLIPAVENSVSAGAFRPGDILNSRKGLSVEINNTDAEGRLVLADALALADEDDPDLVISMATLTGAARVAVGPDLAPFYTGDDALALALSEEGARAADPVWRMPFWDPYEAMIEPGIADLDNAPTGGFAGSITAALFLRRFIEAPFVHFDIYGWQPSAAPGRPKGGAGMGARALLGALPRVLGI